MNVFGDRTMEKPKFGQLLIKLDRLLTAMWTAGRRRRILSGIRRISGTGRRGGLRPIQRPVQIGQDDLIGIETIKKQVVRAVLDEVVP
jgi:hypothetical protein